VRSVFFVHDIIPIEFPEYGVPGEAARHRIRMKTVSERAAAVVVSSEAVRRTFADYLAAEKLRVPPITVAAIGTEPAFQSRGGPALKAARPYFVVCSTIEARKNHLLLLQLWREMAAAHGPDTPALVVVGRRGWESESAVDLLDRCTAIQPHVIEAPGLSTPGLVQLLRGARALLMPSFAEGYGIPVVEALSLGTPVIASNLAVHSEITGPHARLLDPLDGPGWRDAILAAARGDIARPDGFRPPLWRDHFAIVDDLVGQI
jgi:glycosyltransferase involved in cell wall biosynthesis